MKGQRGNPGLKGRLVNKSIEGYILALETINRLSIHYRVETFCYLICNAWELLLKAKILDDAGKDCDAIFRGKKKRNRRRESISLRECLERVIPNQKDPVRRNIECIADLRDESVHLVLKGVPADVLGLFQACVINYHRCLNMWFHISLSDRVNVGMMSIVYDLDPCRSDIEDRRLRRELGRDAAEYLSSYCAQIKSEFDQLERPAQFSVGIEYRLALIKKPGDADIVLSHASTGSQTVQIVEVAKDPSKSHPHRQVDIIQKLRTELPEICINQHDVQCVNKVHGVRQRHEYFYKGTVKGSPGQYSPAYVDWLIQQYGNDQQFFVKARANAKVKTTKTA